MQVKVTINGKDKILKAEPQENLADALRKAGYLSVKRGCEDGNCGACAVILDGRTVNSCLLFTAQVQGRSITTAEGLGSIDKPHPLQTAFVEEGAVQCGYCTPGMLMSAKALLDKNPNPTREEIKNALDGNLCRCTGYVKIVKAVEKAAKVIQKQH
jgi:carbon-monoxide dehydrogenase small subunit